MVQRAAKRQAAVVKAKEDLRFKQLFKSPSGGKQSTVDEEKTLANCLRRLAEADQKIANVKKWIRQLHQEAHMYKGSVQRLATTVSVDFPNAAAKILRMLTQVEAYPRWPRRTLGRPSKAATAPVRACRREPARKWAATNACGKPPPTARPKTRRPPSSPALDPGAAAILPTAIQTCWIKWMSSAAGCRRDRHSRHRYRIGPRDLPRTIRRRLPRRQRVVHRAGQHE